MGIWQGGRGDGREEGGVGKEKTQEMLEQGNDLLGGHLVYFHI